MTEFDKMEKANRDQHKELYEGIKELAIQIAKMPEKLSHKFDGKYAPKWTEKAWMWLIGTVGVMLVGAVMGQILINNAKAFF